jgi:hypothetical protein
MVISWLFLYEISSGVFKIELLSVELFSWYVEKEKEE